MNCGLICVNRRWYAKTKQKILIFLTWFFLIHKKSQRWNNFKCPELHSRTFKTKYKHRVNKNISRTSFQFVNLGPGCHPVLKNTAENPRTYIGTVFDSWYTLQILFRILLTIHWNTSIWPDQQIYFDFLSPHNSRKKNLIQLQHLLPGGWQDTNAEPLLIPNWWKCHRRLTSEHSGFMGLFVGPLWTYLETKLEVRKSPLGDNIHSFRKRAVLHTCTLLADLMYHLQSVFFINKIGLSLGKIKLENKQQWNWVNNKTQLNYFFSDVNFLNVFFFYKFIFSLTFSQFSVSCHFNAVQNVQLFVYLYMYDNQYFYLNERYIWFVTTPCIYFAG